MGRKKKPGPDDKEQSARFIEAAERIESDDPEGAFKDAIRQVLPEVELPKKPETESNQLP
jgi:hypothetical protein